MIEFRLHRHHAASFCLRGNGRLGPSWFEKGQANGKEVVVQEATIPQKFKVIKLWSFRLENPKVDHRWYLFQGLGSIWIRASKKTTQALHTNSNPSITAKSPIISLGYTRIIKKQGALNKKTQTKHKDFSQSTLNCVPQHLQPSYRMYRPSCITGMLNFNSSAFQTSGCSGGGQIFRHHFIDFS